MRMMRFVFISIVLSLIFVQVSCSKKVSPVSGSAGLNEEQESQVVEGANAPVTDSAGEREEVIGFNDTSEKVEPLVQAPALKQGGQDSEVLKGLHDIYFEYDKAVLSKESKEALQENARHLILHPTAKIQIEGHTDERGSNEYNLALGARRSRAVKRFLEALGVESSRMNMISFGEENPSCTKSHESCWKMNRRTHFTLQP